MGLSLNMLYERCWGLVMQKIFYYVILKESYKNIRNSLYIQTFYDVGGFMQLYGTVETLIVMVMHDIKSSCQQFLNSGISLSIMKP